jgi:hypothetical protein
MRADLTGRPAPDDPLDAAQAPHRPTAPADASPLDAILARAARHAGEPARGWLLALLGRGERAGGDSRTSSSSAEQGKR